MQLKKKDSRIELLRLLSIVMIVFHHLSEYGITRYADGSVWPQGSIMKRILASLMLPGGEVGVAIFFMITGYFCITRENRRNISSIISTTLFYAGTTFIICIVSYFVARGSFQEYSFNDLFRMLVSLTFNPITGSTWWYVAAYVFLNVLIPDINRLYKRITGKKKIIILIFMCVIWYGAGRFGSSFFILYKAVFFYLIGGYIKTDLQKMTSKTHGGGYILIGIFTWVIYATVFYLSNEVKTGESINALGLEMMQLLCSMVIVPVCAISLFLFILSCREFTNITINKLASCVFGIYLIHAANPINYLIWNHWFGIHRYFRSETFILWAIVFVLIVMIAGTVIDRVRKKVFDEKIINTIGTIQRFFVE